jgi:hypothetical protein
MRRSLLLAVLLLAGAFNLYSLDRNAFTITSYRLNVQVDRNSHVFAVTYGRLVLRNDSKVAQKNVSLQISSSLEWNDIGADDDPLDCNCFAQPKRKLQWLGDPYTSDIDHTGSLSEAIVTLEKPVPSGGSVAIDVQYGGKITPDSTRLTRMGLPQELALHSDWDQVSEAFTAVRGLGYVVWYPVSIEAVSMSDGNAVSDGIALWQERHRNSEFFAYLGVTAPAKPPSPCIASNAPKAKGYWTVGGGANDPNAPPDAGAQDQQQQLRGITLEAHGLQNTTPAFAMYSICDELSRPSADITFIPDHSLVAKDYATAAEASGSLLDNWLPQPENRPIRVIELTDPDASPYQDEATLFVPLVSTTQPNLQLLFLPTQVAARFATPRPWMQKGLGLFMQAIFNRERGGRDAALKFLDQYEAPLAKAEELARSGNNPGKSSQPVSDSDNTLLNTTDELYLRVKGGFVFWMLHDMLGETALQHALAAYRASADREPTYFQKLLELQTRHDLEWFFDDWVYRDRGLPDFRVATAFSRKLLSSTGQGNEYQVTVTIENLGRAGAEVPVTVETANGEKVVRVLVRAHDKGYARVEVPELPTRVVVNDGSVPESDKSNNVYVFENKPQS